MDVELHSFLTLTLELSGQIQTPSRATGREELKELSTKEAAWGPPQI
jgi:hypothetical protein